MSFDFLKSGARACIAISGGIDIPEVLGSRSTYPLGAPGGTEPIVLHRDAASGGGYFMLGTVISADMDLIGRLQPHVPTKFVSVDMETALAARHDRQASSAKLREALD